MPRWCDAATGVLSTVRTRCGLRQPGRTGGRRHLVGTSVGARAHDAKCTVLDCSWSPLAPKRPHDSGELPATTGQRADVCTPCRRRRRECARSKAGATPRGRPRRRRQVLARADGRGAEPPPQPTVRSMKWVGDFGISIVFARPPLGLQRPAGADRKIARPARAGVGFGPSPTRTLATLVRRWRDPWRIETFHGARC